MLVGITCINFIQQAAANPAGAETCNAALNKDLISTVRSDQQQYAYLNRIDKETFEEVKHDASAGVSIPIVKGLIDASADYSDFKQRREKFFHEINYTASLDYEERIFQVVTTPIAYAAWSKCMSDFAKTQIGFYVWKSEDRPDVMVVNYRWTSPPTVTSAKAISEVTGGKVKGAAAGQLFPARKKFGPNEEGTIQVHRNPGAKTLLVTMRADGYSAPPLRSIYEAQPSTIGVAFMKATYDAERLVQSDLTTSNTSLDRHNKDCPGDGAPCDGTGRWEAAILPLSLDAGQNRILRATRVTCDGMPPNVRAMNGMRVGPMTFHFDEAYRNVCAYMNLDEAPVDGKRTATAKIRTWTRPTYFTLHADVYEPQPSNKEGEKAVIIPNETFTIRDYPDAKSRVIVARACGIDSPATPGQDSPDGRLKFVGKAGIGPDTMLVYRYVTPLGSNGKPVPACGVTPEQLKSALQLTTQR